jgi:large repetitive protein
MNSKKLWLKRAAAITFAMPLILLSACGGSGTPAPTIPSNVYRIGGTISGLADGNSITLTNNGGDAVTKSTNGSFRFSNALVDGSNFKIVISSLPNNQPCTSTYNTGTVNGATIDHINVFCGPVPNSGVKATTPMAFPLHSHAATVLIDGSVLVTGGVATITTNLGAPGSITSSGVVPYAHTYNPTTKVWKGTPTNMAVARQRHTSTLFDEKLRLEGSGKVLVVGGSANSGALSSAEIYDVETATWSSAASLTVGRSSHTATVIGGLILVVGGLDALGTQNIRTAEIFNPSTGTWTATGSTLGAHGQHTATLLPNGKVLVVGWNKLNPATNSAEIYDPATGQWSATGNLATPRSLHTATLLANGKVLVTGGVDRNTPLQLVSTFETYDPTTGIWTTEGSGSARSDHTAAALFNGKVLLSGGYTDGLLTSTLTDELYDPTTKSITPTTNMLTARFAHTASVLGNGEVLLVGGISAIPPPSYTVEATAKADLYGTFIAPALWDPTGALEIGAINPTATLLQNGKVLLAGGYNPSGSSYSSFPKAVSKSQVFDETTGLWSLTGNLAKARSFHAATLLNDGRVLVTGGDVYAVAGGDEVYSELFAPTSGLWSKTANISKQRIGHTSTRLLDGRVLIAGGNDASAEIFNPNTNTWAITASMSQTRSSHTATLLPNGKVLVVGGNTLDPTVSGNLIVVVNAAAELFDPATGTWSFTGPVAQVRGNHQATLLPDGKVLVSGGRSNGNNNVTNTEVYDPATNSWVSVGNIIGPRHGHTATLLPTGKVLINGGSGSQQINTAALFDPISGNWTETTGMYHTISGHRTTLLPSGRALSAAGNKTFFIVSLNPVFSEIFW